MKCWNWIFCCLFAVAVAVGAETSETDSSEPVTPKLARKAISIIENDPLGEAGEAAVAAIIQFSFESEEVLIQIDEEITSLLALSTENKHGKLLLAAFIAGNVKAQLETGVCEDRREAGIAQLIATYNYLKSNANMEPIEALEESIKDKPAPEKENGEEEEAEEVSVWQKHIEEAQKQLKIGAPLGAIEEHLDPVINHFEDKYRDDPRTIYCADSLKISTLYVGKAAMEDAECVVLPGTWAEAYYLKAYALVEMKQFDGAKACLKQAVTLSPYNPGYWSELGHILQLEKNWSKCLVAFGNAAKASEHYEGDEKIAFLTRAWRGIGFALIEQGKLWEAEEKFKQCLELNPNDERARSELKYISGLRGK